MGERGGGVGIPIIHTRFAMVDIYLLDTRPRVVERKARVEKDEIEM